MHDGALQLPNLLLQNVRFYPVQKILVHPVFPRAVFHLPVESLNLFQPPHPQLDLIQRALQILIRAHILPQNVDIHFLLVQHIRVDEILDIINWPESHGLGDQLKEFIFQTAEAVLDHLLRILLRGTPGLDLLPVTGPELGDGSGHFSLKKKSVLQPLPVHQIAHRLLLSFRRGVHHRTDDKIFLPLLLIEFQRHMGADLSGPLIGPVLAPGLAADIAGQLPLAVLVGRLIEIVGGAGHHKLDGIEQCGFARTVLTGDQDGILKIDQHVGKPMPVDQFHSRQFLHSTFRPFDSFPAFHKPA